MAAARLLPATRKASRLRAGALGVLLMAGLWSNGHAALFDDDEARKAILELRQRFDTLQQRSDADLSQAKRNLIDLQSQIDGLRNEVATLRGANEQLQRNIADLQRSQKDMVQNVDERLQKFEPAAVNVDGQDIQVDPAAKRDFDAALDVFRGGNFPGAQQAFADFLKRYPNTGYTPSALFWLGNAQYATRTYNEAITNFRRMLSIAPTHARAPEAMLAISNCQLELRAVPNARKTLEDLVKTYPQSEAAATARDRLTKLK